MKRISTTFLTITLVVLITFTTSVFAEEEKDNFRPGSELVELQKSANSTLIPTTHVLDINAINLSFNDLKESANFLGSVVYENGIAIGEVYYTMENGELKYNASASYVNTEHERPLPTALLEYENQDIIIIDDLKDRYLAIKNEDGEFIIPISAMHNGAIATFKNSEMIPLDKFVDAAVYRNKYEYEPMMEQGLVGGLTSVMDNLGKNHLLVQ